MKESLSNKLCVAILVGHGRQVKRRDDVWGITLSQSSQLGLLVRPMRCR